MSIEGTTNERELEKPEEKEEEQVSFLDTLADDLAGTVCSVFGTPVERDGVTVIPVAKARWGMGGGFGTHRAPNAERRRESGIGGGGGAMVKPIGFIELVDGQTRFRSIREPMSAAWKGIATALAGVSALRAVEALRDRDTRVPLRRWARRRARRVLNLFR